MKTKLKHRRGIIMGMEIKINAGDMLKVLVNSGMDSTDAKAIIFDLLNYPEGVVPERRKLKDIKKSKLKKRIAELDSEDDDSEEEDDDGEDDEDDEDSDEDYEELNTTKIRRPKRISFKNFGGLAQPIQYAKKG